jgi:hypothetical protein
VHTTDIAASNSPAAALSCHGGGGALRLIRLQINYVLGKLKFWECPGYHLRFVLNRLVRRKLGCGHLEASSASQALLTSIVLTLCIAGIIAADNQLTAAEKDEMAIVIQRHT